MAAINKYVKVIEDHLAHHVFEPTYRIHFLTDSIGAFLINKLKEESQPASLYTDASRAFGIDHEAVDRYLNYFMLHGLFHPSRQYPLFHDDYIRGYRELPAGYAFPPNAFYWVVTWACNLQCKMCPLWSPQASQHSLAAIKSHPILSLPEAKQIISKLARSGLSVIHITGGEPLLYDHLIDSVRHIKKEGMMATIFSNGTLIDEAYAKNLIQTNVDKIGISLDGTEAVHDQIRGKGNFKQAITGLTHLLKARSDSTAQTRLYFMSTVTKHNFHQLTELLKLAAEMRVDGMFLAHPAFITAASSDMQKRILSSCFFPSLDGPSWQTGQSLIVDQVSEIPVDTLFETINTMLTFAGEQGLEFSPNLIMSKDELHRYYHSDQARVIGCCLWPWQGGFMDPCGRVYPCLKINAGDLRKDDFLDLWNNDIYRRFRRLIKSHHLIPGCERCCQLINEQTRYDLTRLGN